MPLIQIIIVLVVVGVILFLINNYIPMDATIKKILNIVVVIVVILWLLRVFGVLTISPGFMWAGEEDVRKKGVKKRLIIFSREPETEKNVTTYNNTKESTMKAIAKRNIGKTVGSIFIGLAIAICGTFSSNAYAKTAAEINASVNQTLTAFL